MNRLVEALAREARLTVRNTSRHLQVLRGAGLVEGQKEGLFATYRIAECAVCDFFRSMRIQTKRSWPTAVNPTVYWPSRPWKRSEPSDTEPCAPSRVCSTGGREATKSRRKPGDEGPDFQ